MKQKIHAYFRKPYNCAQTVMKIIQEKHNIPDKGIEKAKSHGGGRAPKGMCGALYGLLNYIPEKDHDRIIDNFKTIAGAQNCREIRKLGKLTCHECVEQAIDLFYQRFDPKA